MTTDQRILLAETHLKMAMQELAMCRKEDGQTGAATSASAPRKGGLSDADKARIVAKKRAARARLIQRIKNAKK